MIKFVSVVCFVVVCFVEIQSTVIYNNGLNRYPDAFYPSGVGSPLLDNRRKCPLCDSSVYSYCSDKLFHDSCCCYKPANHYDRLPYECQYADCNFLHANSCKEHELITACCCTNFYLHKRK